jgi:hypothetical protein
LAWCRPPGLTLANATPGSAVSARIEGRHRRDVAGRPCRLAAFAPPDFGLKKPAIAGKETGRFAINLTTSRRILRR